MLHKSEILLAYLNSYLNQLNPKNYVLSIYRNYVAYRNFIKVILYKILNRFPIEAVLKDGKRIVLDNRVIAFYYTVFYTKSKNLEINDSFIEFEYNGKNVRFYGWKYGDLTSTFVVGDYNFLNVEGKVVVDIGASIGDTPIYFALRGAKKVIAFEPFPKTFELAKKNVEENGLQDKITLVFAGCGYDGKVRVREDIETGTRTQLIDQGTGIEVPVYSLNTIVKMFNIEDAVLKVDCEGCEYELFKTATDETLSKFKQIVIEYHYGYKELVNRLKSANFKVKRSIPRRTKRGMILGYIFAWR